MVILCGTPEIKISVSLLAGIQDTPLPGAPLAGGYIALNKYKVYREQGFNTYLPDSTAAQAFANTIMAYAKDIHGQFSIDVPMKYYNVAFGGVVNTELNRQNATMLGIKKCEIIGKTYNLESENINLNLRIV